MLGQLRPVGTGAFDDDQTGPGSGCGHESSQALGRARLISSRRMHTPTLYEQRLSQRLAEGQTSGLGLGTEPRRPDFTEPSAVK
jgi:hypothetical protein